MSDEEWNFQDEGERKKLVERFEHMIAQNESYFFDIEEFESIIEFYIERNRVKKALGVIRYAHQIYPDSTILMLREAQLLASTGKLSRAIPRLKNLLRFEPQNEEILMTLASVYSQLREHKKAIEYLNEAIKHVDDDLRDELWIEMALEYENLERWDKAIETLKDAIKSNPENETAHYELAYCFEMGNRLKESIEYFKGFIDDHPYSFPVWYNLGNIYQKTDQLSEALHCYDYCLVILEDFTPAYLNKAHTLVKMERYEEAITNYEELLRFEPEQASTLCFIGECYERIGKLEEAEEYYKRSINVDEEFADSWIGLGVIADLQEMTDASLRFFERAINIEPENVDFLLLMAAALKKLDLFKEAGAVYENALTLDMKNIDLWLDHADNAIRSGDSVKSLELIREAIQHNPDDIDLQYREVAILYRGGKRKEAYGRLEELLARSFENSQSLLDYLPEITSDPVVIQLLDLYKR